MAHALVRCADAQGRVHLGKKYAFRWVRVTQLEDGTVEIRRVKEKGK